MNAKRTLFLVFLLTISLSVTDALADGRRSGAASRPGVGRSAPRFVSSAGRGSPGTFQRSNSNFNANRRIGSLNRSGTNFNRSGSSFNRSGSNWRGLNGRTSASFARNGNWWRRHHNRFIFVGAFGFPWYDPFFYSYYPYGYYPYGYSPYGYSYDPDGSYYNGDPGYYQDADPAYSDSGRYDDQSRNDRNGRQGRHSLVAQVQERLARSGYYKGRIDGVTGSRTYYAIRAYQRDHNLRADGAINDQLLNEMGLRDVARE